MRFIVILLVGLVALSSAEVLHVKCGDEKCEKPSNRAVTKLRYTPDKPYKLQIHAVNSEVEIFGMTDDLYYIRSGKNYGFLPKQHLRETTRGNYPFQVEIDITNRRIDQQVREQNFLHEFLKSSQPVQEPKVNETVKVPETLPAPVNEPSQENPTVNEVPPTIPLDIKVEAPALPSTEAKPQETANEPAANKSEEQVAKPPTTESDEDSGVEDGEDDDDEGDDEDEESVEKSAETEPEKKVLPEQPELIAIPPFKDPESAKIVETFKDVPRPDEKPAESAPVLKPAPASPPQPETVPVTVQETVKEAQTVPEVPKLTEGTVNASVNTEDLKPPQVDENKIPEFIPMTKEVVQEAPALSDSQNNTANVSQEIGDKPVNIEEVKPKVEEVKIVEEIKVEQTTPKSEETVTIQEEVKVDQTISKLEDVAQDLPNAQEPLTQDATNINGTDATEPSAVAEEPAAVETVPISEKPSELPAVEQQNEVPEIPIETETTERTIETNPETAQPESNNVVTEVPQTIEIPQPEVIEMPVTPLPLKPSPDALLQRFNEKLGNRVVEGTGKGSVEHVHREHHHHSHEENHEHHHHEEEKVPELQEKSPETPLEEDTKEQPGFFGGLFKKFFSDADDSEQHFHEQAKPDNAASPSDQNADSAYCEKIDSEDCPNSVKTKPELNFVKVDSEWKTVDEYLRIALHEALESMDLIISMGLTALTVLIFTLGYYCINKARREGPLIAKMNDLERHLMAAVKENENLKGDVIATRQKLLSIEDNSFGSNDMVIALKQDLESAEHIKNELQDKVVALEKELEAAAEDGLELNRMVSELLNNQTGSESIISSVEDLQRQLNEQQETIITMNETLAAKSRENSELQVQLSEVNGKFQGDFQSFQHQLDAIVLERNNLQIELENLKRESDVQVNQLVEERNGEVTRLNTELTTYAKSYEESKKALNTAESRVQSLEECLKVIKKDSKGGEFKNVFDIADLKADLLAVTKEKSTLQEQLQNDKDARKLLEDRVKMISEEMSNLKKEFGVAEKEKLEAQTRLEVLSTYFKEKETQLQQELSVKEARWMKQQGETTSTVEKVQALNDEIQGLKSQNDSLRAEIEAQVAAHKLNLSSLEAQSHAAWLNARQAERKLEESRMESAALRRRLTSIAENPGGAGDLLNGLPSMINDTVNSIPSPIRVESPNNVNGLPPAPLMMPPPFLPQGFLPGVPPPFLPPPPFMHGDMGPPLGRLMSPPPKRFDERDRYSPRGRGRYSPDSRYDDYTAFETETDYSPPPSPSPPRRGYSSPSDRSKKSKGGHSSAGSIESNPTSRRK